MADDWQVGDLALCVRGGPPIWLPGVGLWENYAEYDLQKGRIYTVDRVYTECGLPGLHFEGLDWAWLANRFVKVTPPEADDFDRETIALYQSEPTPTEFIFDREPHSDRAGGIAPFSRDPAGPAHPIHHSRSQGAEALCSVEAGCGVTFEHDAEVTDA